MDNFDRYIKELMTEEETKCLLKMLAYITTVEFYKAKIVGACLPASIILYEEASKVTKDFYLLCGHAECRGVKIFTHFWCIDKDGTVYDPMAMLKEVFLGVDPSEWSYKPTPHLDDAQMKQIYEEFRKTNSSENYFKGAPKYLHTIRENVQRKCYKVIEYYTSKHNNNKSS